MAQRGRVSQDLGIWICCFLNYSKQSWRLTAVMVWWLWVIISQAITLLLGWYYCQAATAFVTQFAGIWLCNAKPFSLQVIAVIPLAIINGWKIIFAKWMRRTSLFVKQLRWNGLVEFALPSVIAIWCFAGTIFMLRFAMSRKTDI